MDSLPQILEFLLNRHGLDDTPQDAPHPYLTLLLPI